MENTTPDQLDSIETNPSIYLNTLISRVMKISGPSGALHMVCVLNGVNPMVMALSANQLSAALKP